MQHFHSNVTYKIKPSLEDLLSVQQRKDELQITPDWLSTRLPFVDKNCWQEVGKWKDEAFYWSEEKSLQVCFVPMITSHLFIWSEKCNTLPKPWNVTNTEVNGSWTCDKTKTCLDTAIASCCWERNHRCWLRNAKQQHTFTKQIYSAKQIGCIKDIVDALDK